MDKSDPIQLPLFAVDDRGRVHYPGKVVLGRSTYHIPDIHPYVLATIMQRPPIRIVDTDPEIFRAKGFACDGAEGER